MQRWMHFHSFLSGDLKKLKESRRSQGGVKKKFASKLGEKDIGKKSVNQKCISKKTWGEKGWNKKSLGKKPERKKV